MSYTEAKKSNTAAAPWGIKGIDPETRVAVKKAAKKRGEKVGEFVNHTLYNAAKKVLLPPEKVLPAKPLEEQIEEIVKNSIAAQFKAEEERKKQESIWRKLLG